MSTKTRPLVIWLLIVLLVFLSVGGFFGGLNMLLDPSGGSLGLPQDLLAGLPVSSFLLPGLFLIGVMGLLPLLAAYGLWAHRAWAWNMVVTQAMILIAWIGLQLLLWGAPAPIQLFYLVYGVVLLVLCLMPGARAYGRGTPATLQT